MSKLKSQYDELKQHSHLKLNVVGIASSHNAIFNRDGIDLDNYHELLKTSEESNPEQPSRQDPWDEYF